MEGFVTERIHVVGRTLLSLKAMMLTPHALKAAFTQDVDRSAELSLVLNPRSHVLLQLLISYSVRAREFSARAKQKPTQLATQQHTSDPPSPLSHSLPTNPRFPHESHTVRNDRRLNVGA